MKKLWILLLCLFSINVMATDYSAIDQYAYDAPPLKTQNGLQKLVAYLVKPYKTDAEKARVLLAWIVHNINYDFDKANKNNNTFVIPKLFIGGKVTTFSRDTQIYLQFVKK